MAAVTALGLGKTMEKKLHSVGVRLKEQYPNTCVVILYHLESAIRGIEIKQLDDNCKSELKSYFKQL